MGDGKKWKKAFEAYAPLLGWSDDEKAYKQQWKDFRANVKSFWENMEEIRDTAIEARKEAWNKIFPMLMDMQDKVADSLPDEFPTPPGMPESPVTPKEVMNKVRDFQEMANKHAVEQADSVVDFCKQGEQQVKEAVTDTVNTIEEKLDE